MGITKNIVVIEEPMECPICLEEGRSGFLHRLFLEKDETYIVPNIGATKATHKCDNCGAIFGFKS